MTQIYGLHRAIEIAGGLSKFCRLVGIPHHQNVQYWRKTKVPAEWCKAIEVATGVPRAELRPDLFLDHFGQSAEVCNNSNGVDVNADCKD